MSDPDAPALDASDGGTPDGTFGGALDNVAHDSAAAAHPDPLDAAREELARLDGLAVTARVAPFERVNALLAAELAALDEV